MKFVHACLLSLTMAMALSLVSTGCAVKGRTPEAVTADYGTKIAKTVKAAQVAVHDVGSASDSLVVKKGALKALEGLDKVNTAGLALADELDKLTTINKAIQDAKDDYDRGLRDRARRALTDLRQQDPAAFADVLDEFRTG